jgi:hypothetical protein
VSQLILASLASTADSHSSEPCASASALFAGGDERVGTAGDEHRLDVRIVTDHVGDRRRHDRAAAGQIFGVLVGEMNLVDSVDRERHQGDIPAAR